MAREKNTESSPVWEFLKTSTFCTMFGAMVGGTIAYQVENEESNRHLATLENQVYNAERGFSPTRDSLTKRVFHYKFQRDSLKVLLDYTSDSLRRYVRWVERNQPALQNYEENLKNCKDESSLVKTQLNEVQDSLENCQQDYSSGRYDLDRSLQTVSRCENERDALYESLDSMKQMLNVERREVEIRDNQLDSIETMLNKHKNRYVMETEFAMLTTCIYGHGNSMTKSQYLRQAKCCVEYIRKIQKKYPTDKELKNIQDDFEIKNVCGTSNYYDYDD